MVTRTLLNVTLCAYCLVNVFMGTTFVIPAQILSVYVRCIRVGYNLLTHQNDVLGYLPSIWRPVVTKARSHSNVVT